MAYGIGTPDLQAGYELSSQNDFGLLATPFEKMSSNNHFEAEKLTTNRNTDLH